MSSVHCSHHPHFIDEETKVQGDQRTHQSDLARKSYNQDLNWNSLFLKWFSLNTSKVKLTASPECFDTVFYTFLHAQNNPYLFLNRPEVCRLDAANWWGGYCRWATWGSPRDVLNSGRGREDAEKWSDLGAIRTETPQGLILNKMWGIKEKNQEWSPMFKLKRRCHSQPSLPCAGTSTAVSCTAWLPVRHPKFYVTHDGQPIFTNEESTWNIYKAFHYYFSFLTET